MKISFPRLFFGLCPAVLALIVLLPTRTYGDPPDWAPAHGARHKHKHHDHDDDERHEVREMEAG